MRYFLSPTEFEKPRFNCTYKHIYTRDSALTIPGFSLLRTTGSSVTIGFGSCYKYLNAIFQNKPFINKLFYMST